MIDCFIEHPLACTIGAVSGILIVWILIRLLWTGIHAQNDYFMEEVLNRAFTSGNMVIGTRNPDGTYTIKEFPRDEQKREGTDPQTPDGGPGALGGDH